MPKIKKYANGGSYYVTVKESPKPSPPKEKPKPNTEGWNIPVLRPDK